MNNREIADNPLRQCDAALDGQSNDRELRARARRSIEIALEEVLERGRREERAAWNRAIAKFNAAMEAANREPK